MFYSGISPMQPSLKKNSQIQFKVFESVMHTFLYYSNYNHSFKMIQLTVEVVEKNNKKINIKK